MYILNVLRVVTVSTLIYFLFLRVVIRGIVTLFDFFIALSVTMSRITTRESEEKGWGRLLMELRKAINY